MKELLDTLGTWRAGGTDRRRHRPRRRRPHVRLRAAARRRGPARTPPTAGSRARSAAAASRAPRPRRSSGHGRPVTPGSSATGSATSRRGTWGWPAAARSTCSSSRSPPAVVIDAARGSMGAGGHGSAVDHATPRRLATGRVRPAPAGRRARRPRRSWSSTEDGRLTGHAGRARARRRARRGRPGGAPARPVADGRAGRSVAVHRGLPGPAAARRRRWRSRSPARWCGWPASSASRPSSSTAARRSRRRSASPTSTGSSSAGRTRSPTRSGSGRTTPSPSCRTTSSSTSRRSSRRCIAAAATSAPSARSKTQADRRARLLEAGVSEAELARLRGPVGLDLGGRAPAETALAILAEIVAERYGGVGRADARAGARDRLTRVRGPPRPWRPRSFRGLSRPGDSVRAAVGRCRS